MLPGLLNSNKFLKRKIKLKIIKKIKSMRVHVHVIATKDKQNRKNNTLLILSSPSIGSILLTSYKQVSKAEYSDSAQLNTLRKIIK